MGVLEKTRWNWRYFKWPILIFSIAFLLLAAIVPVITVMYLKENMGKNNQAVFSPTSLNLDNYDRFDDGLFVFGYVTSIDTVNCLIKMTFIMIPGDNYLNENGQIANATSFQFDTAKSIDFRANERMPSQDISFPLTQCDSNAYPFDTYTVEDNYLRAYQVSAVLPVGGALGGGIMGYELKYQVSSPQNGFLFSISATRSWTTKFFSGFIFILLWLVTICAASFAMAFLYLETAELAVISVMTSLLFAMPNVRNTQPGIPGIGCTADIAGFFWNMMIISLCDLAIMFKFVMIKYKKTKSTIIAKEEKEKALK